MDLPQVSISAWWWWGVRGARGRGISTHYISDLALAFLFCKVDDEVMILNAAQLDSKFFKNFPSSKIWKEGKCAIKKQNYLWSCSCSSSYFYPCVLYQRRGLPCSYISCSNNISCFAPSQYDKNWTGRQHQCPVVPKGCLSHVSDMFHVWEETHPTMVLPSHYPTLWVGRGVSWEVPLFWRPELSWRILKYPRRG